jgi:hypothetical protein
MNQFEIKKQAAKTDNLLPLIYAVGGMVLVNY